MLALVVIAGLLSAPSVIAQTATVTATRTATPTRTITLTPSLTNTRPTPVPTRTITITPGPGNYVVQEGDQLWKIAQRFGTTVIGLMALNNLESDTIFPGQVLALPTPLPTKTKPPTPPLPTGSFYYIVQPGDQLLQIARRFGVTTAAIRTASRISGDAIFPGQVLVIPPPSPTKTPRPPGTTYVVQSGDQLRALARRFGLTVAQLKSANGLTSDTIQVGQVLFIPTPLPPPTATRTPTAIPAGVTVHFVQTGDRLQIIAVWYGVTIKAIRDKNGLSSDNIAVGQALVIPNPTRTPMEYVIQPGDTLVGLAQRFETTVEALKIANKIPKDKDTIFRGLILIIPVKR